VFLEVMLGFLLRERLPHDRLTPYREGRSPMERRLRRWMLLGVLAGAALGALGFLLLGLGPAILLACLPLAVPGWLAHQEEKAIRRREADYPAFIRSVGAAAAARGGAIRDVLGNVQANNLGALTVPVRELHRRLMWRVDDRGAWRAFGQETGSRLIDAFTSMFVQGVAAGGKPGPIADIISNNMLKILALRTTRRATAGAFRGLLLGLTVGLAAVLFMGFGIFASITGTFSGFADVLAKQGLFSVQEPGALGVAQTVLLVLLGLHGLACGLFFKLVEGGRLEGAALHVVAQVWAGVAAAMLVSAILPRLLSFSGGA
jgi:flagellar protein FlaJ